MADNATPLRYTALNSKEHDQDEPKTKRVSVYGWDGSQKTRIAVDETGKTVVTGTIGIDTTGLATSDKQLPDGHEVEVNNLPTEYPLPSAQITTLTPPAQITGFATSSNQTDGSQVNKIKETIPTDATKVNASLALSNVDMVQASTKTITKTIGATSYTKTLSLNAGGDVIGVSAWSEI